MSETSIEKRIEKYVAEKYTKLSSKEVSEMTIQTHMRLVNMHCLKQWDIFKLELRKAGYII